MHEFVRHYAKETLAQFQTASADLAQAMKADESSDYLVQPQPKYQEQFSLHRANENLNSDSEARTQHAPTELLTDFNASRPQAVHYADQTPKYNGSAQLNNALKLI